jgi:hypothetical protein
LALGFNISIVKVSISSFLNKYKPNNTYNG